MTYSNLKQSILSDPSASFWLKTAVTQLENRDPCDAIADVEILYQLVTMRMEDVFGGIQILSGVTPQERIGTVDRGGRQA